MESGKTRFGMTSPAIEAKDFNGDPRICCRSGDSVSLLRLGESNNEPLRRLGKIGVFASERPASKAVDA